MYNWSVDTKRLKKDSKAYEKFALEQRINYGLVGEKLSIVSLRKYWDELDIDENKRNYLKKIIW